MENISKTSLYLLIFITLISSVSCGSDSLELNKPAYITVARLNYRNRPGLSGKRMGLLNLGESVIIIKKSKKKMQHKEYNAYWYYFRKRNKRGWIYGAFLAPYPIASTRAMAKKLRGYYYYYQLKNRKKDLRKYNIILRIKNKYYEQYIYNYNLGITDKIIGQVAFQANSIELYPFKRISRPAQYAHPGSSAYQKAYHVYSRKDHTLTMNNQPFTDFRKKLYFLDINGKIYLTETTQKDIKRINSAYEKK